MPRYSFPALINTLPAPSIPMEAKRAPSPVANPTQTALEKFFPHILDAIQAMWGYRELNVYLARLTIDNRGDREGFPAEVWEDLYLVMRLHDDVFPRLTA